MKYQILIELTFMLLARKKVTVTEIMNRFEISRSTVFRYIDALSLAKIPVAVTHGRNGGFFVPEEYKLQFGYFTDEELRIMRSVLELIKDHGKDFDLNLDCDLKSITLLTEKLSALIGKN